MLGKAPEVLKYPDPRLLKVSEPVSIKEAGGIVKKLIATSGAQQWGHVLGMAAPQIGISRRVFIAQGVVYINPEIKWESRGTTLYKEGCYSLERGKYDYAVTRSQSIVVKWFDLEGTPHEERFNGRNAQIILHEFDHLEGRLCSGAGRE